MTSFIVPPAASIRCLIFVNVSRAWLYMEPSPSTPPLPSPAVMPATKTWLPYTRQFDHVPGAGSFSFGLLTRCIFMAHSSVDGAPPDMAPHNASGLYAYPPWLSTLELS